MSQLRFSFMPEQIEETEETEDQEPQNPCSSCGDHIEDDQFTCDRCNESFHYDCAEAWTCNDCGNNYCSSCAERSISECSSCNELSCCRSFYSCDRRRCGESVCENCSRTCECGSNTYCDSCADNYGFDCDCCCDSDDEPDLYDASDNPRIFNYSAKPDWTFHKQPWENTLYLGVELEMGFPSGTRDQVLGIAAKHLYAKHIWKEDGSINSTDELNDGAELVIAPHTLQAFKQVKIKEMLKELTAIGARSYDHGNCGIHVHTNKNHYSGDDIIKLKEFFCNNRQFIKRFSARAEEKLHSYARIPESVNSSTWHDRYVALNDTGKTLEFRIFRGTLNYERFKAILQFVDAMVSFVKQHSRATCKGNNGLKAFKEFIRPKYPFLFNYITKKGF